MVIPVLCQECNLGTDIGINRVDPADIAIGWWWAHGVDVLLSAVGGVR